MTEHNYLLILECLKSMIGLNRLNKYIVKNKLKRDMIFTSRERFLLCFEENINSWVITIKKSLFIHGLLATVIKIVAKLTK